MLTVPKLNQIFHCSLWHLKEESKPFSNLFSKSSSHNFTPPFKHTFSKTHFCKKPAFQLKPNLPPNRLRYLDENCMRRDIDLPNAMIP